MKGNAHGPKSPAPKEASVPKGMKVNGEAARAGTAGGSLSPNRNPKC